MMEFHDGHEVKALIERFTAEVRAIRGELKDINRHLERLNGTVDDLEENVGKHETRLSLVEYITNAHKANWTLVITTIVGIIQAVLAAVLLAKLLA